VIFGQCDLGKPPTTLGENQFESFYLFGSLMNLSENAFTEKLKYTVKIPATTNYNLSLFPCLNSTSKIMPISNQPKPKFLQQ